MSDPTVAQVLPHVSSAIEARDIPRAFELLSAFSSQLDQHRELALTWLTLLRIAPSRASLQSDAARILARWPDDPELVSSACDA